MWKELWTEIREELDAKALQERAAEHASREAGLADDKESLLKALQQQRSDYERRLAARSSELQTAKDELGRVQLESKKRLRELAGTKSRDAKDEIAQLDCKAADAARQLEQQKSKEEEDKVKRIEHLCGMTARRIMKKDLARGFTAWYDKWAEERRLVRVIQHAASKLHNPELSFAFALWIEDWYEAREDATTKAQRAAERTRQAEVNHTIAAMQATLDAERTESAKKVRAAEAAYSSVMERLEQVDGSAAAAERRLQEQRAKEAADKEQRVEHLCGMIARRIMKKDLARGWSAWQEKWAHAAYQRRLLQNAGSRLHKPALGGAFSLWKHDWQAERLAAQQEAQKRREEELAGGASALRTELKALRADYEAKLVAAAEEKRLALEQQLEQILGERAGQLRVEQEKDKEARVDLLCRQMLRRMLYADYTRGWTSWYEFWASKVHRMRCMQKAASRLTKPAMAAAFAWWIKDWDQTRRSNEREQEAAKRAELEAKLRDAKLEAGKLSLIEVAQSDELRALKSKVVTLSNDVTGKAAALLSAEEVAKQYTHLQSLHATTHQALTVAERERDEAVKQGMSEQAVQKELLKQLLSEQRATMEDSLGRAQKEVAAFERELKQAREEIARLEKQLLSNRPVTPKNAKKGLQLSGDPNKSISEQARAVSRSAHVPLSDSQRYATQRWFRTSFVSPCATAPLTRSSIPVPTCTALRGPKIKRDTRDGPFQILGCRWRWPGVASRVSQGNAGTWAGSA